MVGKVGSIKEKRRKEEKRKEEVVSPSVRKEHSLLCVAEKGGKSVS